MADASQGWWKLTFLRKKKKVVYEIPAEYASNTTSTPAGAAHPEGSVHDPQLDARLERIVEKETAREGRHVKVSHSGRFKEKKKVRSTLAENPDMFQGTGDHVREEKKRAGKWPKYDGMNSKTRTQTLEVQSDASQGEFYVRFMAVWPPYQLTEP